jgi:hypothetical protein
MRTPWTALAALALTALLTASCQKIEGSRGPLSQEKIALNDAISLQYGELVTVTTHPKSGAYVLWFVKPDKTIVAVGVHAERGALSEQILTIPRR